MIILDDKDDCNCVKDCAVHNISLSTYRAIHDLPPPLETVTDSDDEVNPFTVEAQLSDALRGVRISNDAASGGRYSNAGSSSSRASTSTAAASTRAPSSTAAASGARESAYGPAAAAAAATSSPPVGAATSAAAPGNAPAAGPGYVLPPGVHGPFTGEQINWMRETGFVLSTELTELDPMPANLGGPEDGPFYFIWSGVDPDRPELGRIMGVFRSWGHAARFVLKVSGASYRKVATSNEAWDMWRGGFLDGTMRGTVHPASIFPRVVTRDELHRRAQQENAPLPTPPPPPPSSPRPAANAGPSAASASQRLNLAAEAALAAQPGRVFVVLKGAQPGIYTSREAFVVGRGSNPMALTGAYATLDEAEDWFSANTREVLE
ncbi:hypothetical protein PsYK624_146970 [Phanerochaete sordida]|uniref:Uncharacterized protein n=1 Tax=Phanerochaete sordida TaxID=48140 RepID=A0A9P3GN38_9APHY|nr:hypothetical protein PsYK624_146970 [Phanerochaete sordida]